MKKKIFLGLLAIFILGICCKVNASSYSVKISFFANGGAKATDNIEIVSDLVFLKDTIVSDETYTSSSTISKLNSMQGQEFHLKKNNKAQTTKAQWYSTNYTTGKKVYFDESKSIKVTELVKKLGIKPKNNEEIDIYLYANFTAKEKDKDESIKLNVFQINKINILSDYKYPLKKVIGNYKVENYKWSSSDKGIVTVDSKGNITANKEGTATIRIESKNNSKAYDTIKVNVTYVPEINKSLTNCKTIDNSLYDITYKTGNGNTSFALCVKDFVYNKGGLTDKPKNIQSLAITDNYIYFNAPLDGTWVTNKDFDKFSASDVERISRNYIMRISRSTGKTEYTKIEYAGHGQSFDAHPYTKSDGTVTERIFINSATEKTLHINTDGSNRIGVRSKAVAITTFNSDNNIFNKIPRRVQGNVIFIEKDGYNLKRVKKSSFKENLPKWTKSNLNKFYDELQSLAVKKDDKTGSYKYRASLEAAVDENNDRIAIAVGTGLGHLKVLVYKLSDFVKGKATIIKDFDIDYPSKQGLELAGNNLYVITGDPGDDFRLSKYNIISGQKEKDITLDLSKYATAEASIKQEAEGLTYNNGHLYFGLVLRKCAKITDFECSKYYTHVNIVRVDNF